MKLEQLFYRGQLHACFQLAQQQAASPFAQQVIALYERYQLGDIPGYTAYGLQSLERADETYVEQDEVLAIRTIKDEQQFAVRTRQLEEIARTGTDEERAQSFFTQAQLFLYAHHYNESVHCFLQAVKCQPNKALYYGLAAQTMQRLDYTPFEILGYLERAIDLDDKNARWYWNRALVLMELYKDLQQDAFLEQALIALEQAQSSCRTEQKSLRAAIENTVENMREYIF
ncbi:O-linked GlcNAc transferase [Lysinibacillus louembei]|uniref:O-linked GlcNAc transferase n=1 Tax=Lysinibacillus louembei TaxID=1470088 RepID=A0ABZ0RTQ3_9BACI|nr:O-linked GlcNAc transferase [Lysinibacillus louembei]WPK11505.1 O-linked GlcNAc transferase [Lysinibacillus louembei]